MALLSPAPTETGQMQAFCGQGADIEIARGNPCQISLLDSAPTSQALHTRMRVTHCLSWPTGATRAEVACYTPDGKPITVCGHGLLCTASHWLEHWKGPGTLAMGAVEVACRVDNERIWLGFEPLPLQDCEVPHWASRLTSVEPVGATTAGPSDGYLVLEWPANFALNSLTAPKAGWLAGTERALIATCQVSPQRALLGETIQYRYFAPQYGVTEDPATGSAMRVLATYWQQAPDGETLTAYQCSKEGGLLFSRVEEGKTWVGGWTSTQSEQTVLVQQVGV